MSFTDELKSFNIKFDLMNENSAEKIVQTEFPLYKLMEYSILFDKYKNHENFINLDFYHLYLLAKLDEEISHIILKMSAELELALKTLLIDNSNHIGETIKQQKLNGFYESERDYLELYYNLENFDILNQKYHVNSIFELNFEQFIDFIQFGTFEKFFAYCYDDIVLPNQKIPYYIMISSARKLRNYAAHNISIITGLKQKSLFNKNRMSAYLGSKGIKSRTLHSNMDKDFMLNFLSLIYLYVNIVPKRKIINVLNQISILISKCEDKFEIFEKNQFLLSSLEFFKISFGIICKEENT